MQEYVCLYAALSVCHKLNDAVPSLDTSTCGLSSCPPPPPPACLVAHPDVVRSRPDIAVRLDGNLCKQEQIMIQR